MFVFIAVGVAIILFAGYISLQSMDLAPDDYDEYCKVDWNA